MIVNSPLFQRLRRLHQTGFAFLTYPSTTHTRFEHSLGVLYQTDKLARSLADKYATIETQAMPAARITALRVAALLHDCSHGPFSHTSEEVYSSFPEIQEQVGVGKPLEGASASETLAHHIFMSEPFERFVKAIQESVPVDIQREWLSDTVLGLGLRKAPLQAHHTDVINGPFDADKLDYIFRDGHYSGLPLGIDLDRLWYATEIHVIRPGELDGVTTPMRSLVMARAGINSLEQIVTARMNLTSSLYHHHKVRACDCMFKGALLYCIENSVPFCGRQIKSAADFLYFTDVSVLAESERSTDPFIQQLIGDILNRRLLKRALVIGMTTFDRPDKPRDEGETLVHQLATAPLNELRRVAELIWEEAGKPGRKEEVWVDFPKKVKFKDLATTTINVGKLDQPEFRTLGDFVPLEQWGKQYVLQKWRGHVFCRPDDVEAVSHAAAKVLSNTYKINFNKYSRLLCNLQ